MCVCVFHAVACFEILKNTLILLNFLKIEHSTRVLEVFLFKCNVQDWRVSWISLSDTYLA